MRCISSFSINETGGMIITTVQITIEVQAVHPISVIVESVSGIISPLTNA
jgi:hypothetical protein